MEGAPPPNAGDNVRLIFTDIMARRRALFKALTEDFDEFYGQCDPHAGRALYLFGQSNGQWSVEVPAEDLPPEIWRRLNPRFSSGSGYNSFRDTMPKKRWLFLVAHDTDSWSQTVAACLLASMPARTESDWPQLFQMIQELPVLWDAVSDYHHF